MVLRRPPERFLQLRGPAPRRPRRPDRHPLGARRAGGVREDLLPGAEAQRLPHRQRPPRPRRAPRRPRLPLHADDPRARLHDARLRAHRGGPLRRLRRLQRGVAARPDPRRALPDGRHRQRGPPRREAHPPEEDRGPRHRGPGDGGDGARRPAHGHRDRHAVGTRPLDGRRDPQAALHLHRGVDGGGRPALRPLHLREHGEAEGPPPHDGRLPRLRVAHAQARLRLPAGRRLHVRGRRGMDHRAHLHRVRARSPTAPPP